MFGSDFCWIFCSGFYDVDEFINRFIYQVLKMTKGSMRLEVSSQVVIMLESTYFGIKFWALDNVADALQLFEIPPNLLHLGGNGLGLTRNTCWCNLVPSSVFSSAWPWQKEENCFLAEFTEDIVYFTCMCLRICKQACFTQAVFTGLHQFISWIQLVYVTNISETGMF